ncbi:MAG: hypothetical protein ABSD38_16230 [Syntrophorhabdales bacterium]|jgi:hypothetical protein
MWIEVRYEESLESVFKGVLDRIAGNPDVDATLLILSAQKEVWEK